MAIGDLSTNVRDFIWFDTSADYLAWESCNLESARAEARAFAGQARVRSYCACCERVTEMRVDGGARFLDQPNLREGLVCADCGLSNRNRLLYLAARRQFGTRRDVRVAVLERCSPLYRALHRAWPRTQGSEFLGETRRPGRVYAFRYRLIRHESVTALSYPDASLHGVVHNDVLEHVEDHGRALAECRRVLRDDGALLFNAPFFAHRNAHLLRGRRGADGMLEHLEPPEYHRDGMHPEGIYTFHHFGWRLLDDLRAAGFRRAQLGVLCDAEAGFCANLHPDWAAGGMLPVILRALP